MNLLTGESIDIIIHSICCVSNSTDMLLLEAVLHSLVIVITLLVTLLVTLTTVSNSYDCIC